MFSRFAGFKVWSFLPDDAIPRCVAPYGDIYIQHVPESLFYHMNTINMLVNWFCS